MRGGSLKFERVVLNLNTLKPFFENHARRGIPFAQFIPDKVVTFNVSKHYYLYVCLKQIGLHLGSTSLFIIIIVIVSLHYLYSLTLPIAIALYYFSLLYRTNELDVFFKRNIF